MPVRSTQARLGLILAWIFVLALTAPLETAAAGGCRSDADCKGDRSCHEGACVDPSKLPCGADVDCPGDLLCERGACVDPSDEPEEDDWEEPEDDWEEPQDDPRDRRDESRKDRRRDGGGLDVDDSDLRFARDKAGDVRRRVEAGTYLFVQGTVLYVAGSVLQMAYLSESPSDLEYAGLFYGGALLAAAPSWGGSYGAISEGYTRANDGLAALGAGRFRLQGRDRLAGLAAAWGGLYGAGLLSTLIASASWEASSFPSNHREPGYYSAERNAIAFGAVIPGVLCIASAIPLALLYHHLGRELRRAGSDLQDELRVVAAARRPQPPRPVAVSLWIDRTEGTQGVVASFVW